jgi:long-subunit acyl-CoA synthetase (AMP-forming)
MADDLLILECAYRHESVHADAPFLLQPTGGGRVRTHTWGDTIAEARRLAGFLQRRGTVRGDRIAILSKNCAHFFIAELAIWMAGGVTVALFPNETPEAIGYVLAHSGASLLLIGKLDDWPAARPGIPADLPCVELPLAPDTGLPKWAAIEAGEAPIAQPLPRRDDELALLIYTSGSTGQPKGVMHSFGAITRAARSIVQGVLSTYGDPAHRRVVSYLPLAHAMERAFIECASIVDEHAVQVYFTDSIDTFLDDLRRARPTFFFSVPRLWLKLQQGVLEKLPQRKLDRLLRIPLLGRYVAHKVLAQLGLDQARGAGSGSAPLPRGVLLWYQRLGLQLAEGYGMTEDFSCSHTSTIARRAPGAVGLPLPGVQVRLGEDGEILVKSPGTMMGYYRQPELTAQGFTADGFFRTGDLGHIGEDGLLYVTGRAKDLFKTSKGEYVAPAPIENRLGAHPWIEASMVAGTGQASPYALVQLAPDATRGLDRAELQRGLGELRMAVNAQAGDYDRLQMIVVARTPWTIADGLLTPTLKIKRAAIERSVAAQVDDWYARGATVVWA